MSFDFSNIRTFDIDAARRSEYLISEITLEDADGVGYSPTLIGVCANEKNVPFRDAGRKLNAKATRRGARLTPAQIIELARANARTLFPGLVIVDWSEVYNAEGKPVPFSVEACRDFFEALPDWILQGIIEHFADPTNFTLAGEDDPLTDEEVREVAGN
jgi:hypothetical protein